MPRPRIINIDVTTYLPRFFYQVGCVTPRTRGSDRNIILKIILFSAILKHFPKTPYSIKYFTSIGQLLFKIFYKILI